MSQNLMKLHIQRLFSFLLVIVLITTSYFSQADASKETSTDDYIDTDLSELMDIPLDFDMVNILESHIHKQNEWMLGYRIMHMDMQGNRIGDSRISNKDLLTTYMVAPTAMSMEKHIASVMYAPHDNLTLMVKLPFYRFSMSHQNRRGQKFHTYSEGLGDVAVNAHIVAFRSKWDRHFFSVTLCTQAFPLDQSISVTTHQLVEIKSYLIQCN